MKFLVELRATKRIDAKLQEALVEYNKWMEIRKEIAAKYGIDVELTMRETREKRRRQRGED